MTHEAPTKLTLTSVLSKLSKPSSQFEHNSFMATIKSSRLLQSSCYFSRNVKAALHDPQDHASHLSVSRNLINELTRRNRLRILTPLPPPSHIELQTKNDTSIPKGNESANSKVVEELYAMLEIVADRAEMHKNIGEQRDNWNRLLLNSVNGMTVTAVTTAGLAAVSSGGAPLLALKLSSTLLYMAATGILLVMNKIQPSQLAEEQRNAARLFKQLHREIKSIIAVKDPSHYDVQNVMREILALDRAYPLPLLGKMLDKFPAAVEPAEWWPKEMKYHEETSRKAERHGWNENLEKEMKKIMQVLRRKDTAEYVRLGEITVKVNKILATCGPLFTGIAALGSTFVGSAVHDSWAAPVGLVFGSLATVVNSLEHGGQVGMVVEMYRSSAGFLKLLEENIETNLMDKEGSEREDGELFEMKVALQLGRSLSELRNLANHSSSSCYGQDDEEYASKLF